MVIRGLNFLYSVGYNITAAVSMSRILPRYVIPHGHYADAYPISPLAGKTFDEVIERQVHECAEHLKASSNADIKIVLQHIPDEVVASDVLQCC